MKKYLLLLFIISLYVPVGASVITPSAICSITTPDSIQDIPDFSAIKIRDIEKKLGRKLKLKEKIAYQFIKLTYKKGFVSQQEKTKPNRGKTALILAIVGIASLFIPYIGFFSFLICTTLALILGYKAKKENPADKNARTAVVLGWIGVGLFVLAAALVVAILARWPM